jgi:hypothetical protein
LEDFPRHRDFPDGRFTYCRECKRASDRASYARQPERHRKVTAAWHANNPEACYKIKKKYYVQERVRARYRERARKQRQELHPNYVRNCLKISGVPAEAITPTLIEAQRALMLLRRQLKETT